MDLSIYKKGQGWYTRVNTAIALGLIVVLGAQWLSSDVFANVRFFGLETIYTRAIVFLVVTVIFAVIGYHFIGRHHRFVDFLIAVEGEMKKVNWSSRKEIMGSTYIVIALTIFVAALCFVLDRLFQLLSIWAGVLEYTG